MQYSFGSAINESLRHQNEAHPLNLLWKGVFLVYPDCFFEIGADTYLKNFNRKGGSRVLVSNCFTKRYISFKIIRYLQVTI